MTVGDDFLPGRADLDRLFAAKYGPPESTGPGPRRRLRYGYFTPDDYYEATVDRLLRPGDRWLDVGGGRDVFPSNHALSRELADRAGRLVAVDPSPNVHENPFAHERTEAFIEDYAGEGGFDLLTLRMVAEHIADPDRAAATLARLAAPGGRVIVYTINVWSPVSLAAWAIPFGLHHPIKKVLWRTEEKDTFPVTYRMNTRRALARVMGRHGFREVAFTYLDDCRTFARFRGLNHVELVARSGAAAVGLSYPENCLLGVYESANGSTARKTGV